MYQWNVSVSIAPSKKICGKTTLPRASSSELHKGYILVLAARGSTLNRCGYPQARFEARAKLASNSSYN